MKILYVVPTYYPAVRYGGPIRSVHGLARALTERGHHVHVYTTNVDGCFNADVPLSAQVNLDGVSVWYFPTALGRRLYYSPDMGRHLRKNIAEFDVVHTHSVFLWPTTAAARAARAKDVPYLLSPRGMLVSDLIRRKSWLAKRAWIAAFERHNVEEAAAIHVTSENEASDVEQLGLRYKRLIVVANGTDIPHVSPSVCSEIGVAGERGTVLFLGRLNWKKGLDRLIPAMAHLPEADLIIAGDDDEDYRAILEALAKECGVASRIRFLGPLQDSQKWAVLASANVLALPSYSENFGNVVLEAMAAACPVVVSPEVGLAKVVRESGAGLVVSSDALALAQALRSVLANPESAKAMGEAGRSAVEKRFSWSTIAKEMEQAYERVKKSGPS